MSSIWKDCEVYEPEQERALQYLTKHYFEHCKNETSLLKTYSEFKWRVEAAGRFLKRKTDFAMNIYPLHYFNLDNPNGFRGTKKWYNDYLFRLETRIRQRKTLSDDMKLANLLRCYTKTPNYATYQTCKAYILDNIPDKLNEFCNAITTNSFA